ncbi:MAG: hypothetical protein AB7S38_16575 [Vulcanimicrobiota bacterium]
MVKHVVLCCLVLTLALGCSKTPEPPKQIPSTFYGTFGDVNDDISLTLKVEQDAGNLKGTYRIDRPGKKFDGEFTGTTAGSDVHISLAIPEDIQKRLAWTPTIELELNLGEIGVAELSQKFTAAGQTMPKKLRDRGSVPQLGGWANYQENGQDKKKLIVLYNLVADEPKS